MNIETIAPTKKQITRPDYDSPWKQGLGLYFRDFMEFCFPHIAEQIDWTKDYESRDKDFTTISRGAKIGNRNADKLIKVWMKNGDPTLIVCHIEVERSPKRRKLPKRMMVYRCRTYDLYQLPILSIAILIDDDHNWRIDYHREQCFDTYLEIRYLVIKLWDYRNRRQELESINNHFAMIMLAQLIVLETQRDSEARLKAKIDLTSQLYEKGYNKTDIIQLYNLIDWLITLPKELEPIYNQAVTLIEEEKHMNYINTAQRIGIQQGESILLIRQLQRRFHQVPSNYLNRVQQADADTLLLWGERVLDARALDDVFTD